MSQVVKKDQSRKVEIEEKTQSKAVIEQWAGKSNHDGAEPITRRRRARLIEATTVRMPDELMKALREKATADHKDVSEIIREYTLKGLRAEGLVA